MNDLTPEQRDAIKGLHAIDRLPTDRDQDWYVGWHRGVDAAVAALLAATEQGEPT